METKVLKLSIVNLPAGPNPYETAFKAIYDNTPELKGFIIVSTFWDNPAKPVALILVFQKPI